MSISSTVVIKYKYNTINKIGIHYFPPTKLFTVETDASLQPNFTVRT